MWPILKKSYVFLKSCLNDYQKLFTILGCLLGLVLAIVLIAGGIAAIPFVGPGSLLPLWLGSMLFALLVTGSFGSAGKFIGLSIDTILNKEKLTNEKIGTVAGCALGVVISILSIPLHFVGLTLIARGIILPAMKIIWPFIPLTIGMFGSACAYIGRVVDIFTGDKTVIDLLKPKPAKIKMMSSHQVLNKTLQSSPCRLRRSASLPDLEIYRAKKTDFACENYRPHSFSRASKTTDGLIKSVTLGPLTAKA